MDEKLRGEIMAEVCHVCKHARDSCEYYTSTEITIQDEKLKCGRLTSICEALEQAFLSSGEYVKVRPARLGLGMNITEATERACKESTLLDALTYICIWESERVVKQARENKTWETCFRISLKSVLKSYSTTEPQQPAEDGGSLAAWVREDEPAEESKSA
jgi:hypothetical protein